MWCHQGCVLEMLSFFSDAPSAVIESVLWFFFFSFFGFCCFGKVLASDVFSQSIFNMHTIILTKFLFYRPYFMYNSKMASCQLNKLKKRKYNLRRICSTPSPIAQHVVSLTRHMSSNYWEYFNADIQMVSHFGHYIRSFPWIKEKFQSAASVFSCLATPALVRTNAVWCVEVNRGAIWFQNRLHVGGGQTSLLL